MVLQINTTMGFNDVTIDGNCDLKKFYLTKRVMEDNLNVVFLQNINDLDTYYSDFSFEKSMLSLSYNIYTGISVFPIACSQASENDNANALAVGNLIFDELAGYDWYNYKKGKTIGKKGSENGTIIDDIENINGARITIEKDCGAIPYSITLGIYGLMFHTHFEDNIDNAKAYVRESKFKINKVFELYNIPEENRSEYWQTKHYNLLQEIAKLS